MRKAGYELEDLLFWGNHFDDRPARLNGASVSAWAAGHLLKIRARSGAGAPLRANAVQLQFDRDRGRQNIVVKARQMGLTTWVAGRFFLKTITGVGVLTVQVAQTREAAEGIFGMVQRFWDQLPVPMQTGILRRSRANVGQMVFPELDSEFRVLSASDANAGRGLTIQNLHCSEISRWPGDASATLAGLRAALVPSGEMVLESTPNGAHGCFYEEWTQASQRGLTRHFFPWWMEERYVSHPVTDFTEEELALKQKHDLSPRQIGFRRSLEASYRGLRSQEFAEDPELCFRVSGECCFDMDALEHRLAELVEPLATRRGGALQVWLPPQARRRYILAVDTAGGGSDGDYAALQVIDLETGGQCAEMQQRLGTLELARIAASLAREYHGALLVVERNNHGAGVLAYLDAVEHYPYVYAQGGMPGWLTSASSKPAMISRLGALLVETPEIFHSRRLLHECRTFVSHPGGRTGAASGSHDDCLMAMAIGLAVRAETMQTPSRRGRTS